MIHVWKVTEFGRRSPEVQGNAAKIETPAEIIVPADALVSTRAAIPVRLLGDR